jgi:hypothetical protein
MYARLTARCTSLAVIGLLGCTSEPDVEAVYANPESIPPPEISIELPLENAAARQDPPPRACLLGSAGSCLELDSRPFESCLVANKDCETEGAGIVLLQPAPVESSKPTGR